MKLCAGHDAVVRVGGGGQHRRVAHAGPDIVIGRIGPEHAEIGLAVRIAVIVDPVAAGGEAVEAQHVHHADGGQSRREQVRPLVDHRADQQAAVGAALDRELLRGS